MRSFLSTAKHTSILRYSFSFCFFSVCIFDTYRLQDLEIVKALLDQEHLNMRLSALEREPIEKGVGVVFSSA